MIIPWTCASWVHQWKSCIYCDIYHYGCVTLSSNCVCYRLLSCLQISPKISLSTRTCSFCSSFLIVAGFLSSASLLPHLADYAHRPQLIRALAQHTVDVVQGSESIPNDRPGIIGLGVLQLSDRVRSTAAEGSELGTRHHYTPFPPE